MNNTSWQRQPDLPHYHQTYFNDLDNYNALPNVLRETFLQYGMVKVAMVLDACRMLNIETDTWFTVGELQQRLSAFGFSEKILRTALNDHRVFRIGVERNGKAGRDKHTYQIPRLDRLFAEWVPRKWFRAVVDVLPVQAFENTTSYRAHTHRAMIVRLFNDAGRPIKLTRAFMAGRLGVSEKTVRNYEKTVGDIHVTHRYEYTELVYDEDWNLPAERQRDADGNVIWSAEHLVAMNDEETKLFPAVRAVAAKLITAGYRVYKVKQLTNSYQPITAYSIDLPETEWIPSEAQQQKLLKGAA